MNCYLDSSVVLRKLFGEPNSIREWKKIRTGFSSRLLKIECLRTIDRLRLTADLTNEETAKRLEGFRVMLALIGILPLTQRIQERTEQSFSTPLGTLDGLHLATALLWREIHGDDFVFATHDEQLALAARSHGFVVIGG